LLRKLNVPGSLYEEVLKEMDDELAQKVKSLNLPGVYISYKKKDIILMMK